MTGEKAVPSAEHIAAIRAVFDDGNYVERVMIRSLFEALDAAQAERDEAQRTAEAWANQRDQIIRTRTAELAAAQARIAATEAAARPRLEAGHNDTCETEISPDAGYPCSCGHDGLAAAVPAEGPEPPRVPCPDDPRWMTETG